MSPARMTTKTATAVYSRRMNVIAPSRIESINSCIRSFPGSARFTSRAKNAASNRAAIAATMARYSQITGSKNLSI